MTIAKPTALLLNFSFLTASSRAGSTVQTPTWGDNYDACVIPEWYLDTCVIPEWYLDTWIIPEWYLDTWVISEWYLDTWVITEVMIVIQCSPWRTFCVFKLDFCFSQNPFSTFSLMWTFNLQIKLYYLPPLYLRVSTIRNTPTIPTAAVAQLWLEQSW